MHPMLRVLLLSLSAVALVAALVFLARSGDPDALEAGQMPSAAGAQVTWARTNDARQGVTDR